MPIDNRKYTLLLIIKSFPEPDTVIQHLRNCGFQILEAIDPEDALNIIKVNTPDLIFLDIDHCTQEAIQMIRKMRNSRITHTIPVLFLTSVSNENYIPESLAYDNVDFITKPYRPEEIIIRIQHQLLLLRAQRTIRKQNVKLRQTLEARDKLYAVIAHDLRAPIGTIKMINSSLESQKVKIKNPEILRLFEMINETTEEAFNLLENLLRWTRNQNGKTKTYATQFNINKTIRQVISLFTTIATAKDITLQNHTIGNVSVYADEDMIKTVLRNLLSNAVKFTYPGGRIEVFVSVLPDCVLVSVKDNGKGIAKSMQAKLLKSNEYVTTYGTRNEKGSGLGLVLSQEFIKMNKGKFWFSSQENIGTTFYFTLPTTPSANQLPEERR